jgi:hypothetical protein
MEFMKRNVMGDVEASFLAQEAAERERVTHKYVVERDLGVFWTT